MSDENSNRPTDPTQAEMLDVIRTLAGRMERMEQALVDLQDREGAAGSPTAVPNTASAPSLEAMGGAPSLTKGSAGSTASGLRPPEQPSASGPGTDDDPTLAGFMTPGRLAAEGGRQDRRTATGGPNLGPAAGSPARGGGRGNPKLFRSSRSQDRADLSAEGQTAPARDPVDAGASATSPGEGRRQDRIGGRFSDRADERDTRGIDPALTPPTPKPRQRRRRKGAGLVFVGVLALALFGGLAGYVWLENFREEQRLAQVEREFGDLLEQEPDETLPAEGQSPLPRDEDEDLIIDPTETEGDGQSPDNDDAADPSQEPATDEAEVANAGDDAADAAAVPLPDPSTDADEAEAEAAADGTVEAAAEDATAEAAVEPPALASTAPEPVRQDGPAIETAPLSDVQAVALDRDLAPLPDSASSDLRSMAELAIDGDPDSQHDLANLYASGGEVEQDFERAAFWYQRASANGITNATYNLGVLTARGLGVPLDLDRSFSLFREAAEAGHPDAQFALGIAFLSGNGTDPNPQSAVRWLQAASASGNARGAFALGQLYERGIDGAPDLAAAAGWYQIAAQGGDPQAQDALDRLTAAEAAAPAQANDVPVPTETPTPTSTTGDTGQTLDAELTRDGVRELQTRLNGLGFNAGEPDGLMGPTTAGAIRAFQQSQGLPVTGDATQSVLAAARAAG